MSQGYYKEYDPEPGVDAHNGRKASERVGLLSGSQPTLPITDSRAINDDQRLKACSGAHCTDGSASKRMLGSFAGGIVGGVVACLAVQASLFGKGISVLEQTGSSDASANKLEARASPWAGSTYVNNYPPTSPTNVFPSLFPTNVGNLGPTPTGAEPAIIATAPTQPLQTGVAPLVGPSPSTPGFDIFRTWGNLSPWYSLPVGAFGINEGAAPPEGCHVKGLHFLYRHGARYPTSGGGTADFAQKLQESADQWNATGCLAFLNDWTYKLGAEVLTPFGRQQEYNLGVSLRLKYGFLLDNFTDSLPVFRTTSEDRMLASAVNFALGFFGWPIEGQYEQTIIIEASGFNNTLAPYETCTNSNVGSRGDRSSTYIDEWTAIYLADALQRLQADVEGLTFDISDVYNMQQMCAYETVALGYSKFCELFTDEEWEGFEYSIDLSFWYNEAFGSPVGRVQGLGYVQELVSRLTHTPIATYNSSTNSTLDGDPRTWPLNNVLYSDATHDVVIANILTALNLTTLAASGPLPGDHIPPNRSFRVNQIAPFGSNVQFQLLSCPALSGGSDDGEPSHIRIVLNDGPVPLTSIGECPYSSSGLCPLSTFIAGQEVTTQGVDWNWGCNGNWSVPAGPAWETTDGWYPPEP